MHIVWALCHLLGSCSLFGLGFARPCNFLFPQQLRHNSSNFPLATIVPQPPLHLTCEFCKRYVIPFSAIFFGNLLCYRIVFSENWTCFYFRLVIANRSHFHSSDYSSCFC